MTKKGDRLSMIGKGDELEYCGLVLTLLYFLLIAAKNKSKAVFLSVGCE